MALGTLGAGAALFVATGVLCTSAILCSTRGVRVRGSPFPAKGHDSVLPRPRAAPKPVVPEAAYAALGVPLSVHGAADWLKGRTRS